MSVVHGNPLTISNTTAVCRADCAIGRALEHPTLVLDFWCESFDIPSLCLEILFKSKECHMALPLEAMVVVEGGEVKVRVDVCPLFSLLYYSSSPPSSVSPSSPCGT